MYMPGRSRTGSRPSSTVMSFAVYEVSDMKKALQVTHFRADLSLPDGAAGSGPREACARSFFHCFAKFLGADLRRPAARLLHVLGRGVRKTFVGTLRGRRRGLRERPRGEPQAARSSLPESLFQAREDLALEL